MSFKSKKIVIISSSINTFIGFRWNLINDLMSRGCTVYLLAPIVDCESVNVLKRVGAIVVDIKISRTGKNPFVDIYSVLNMYKVLLKIKPDIVFASMIKPVVYGSIAAWLAGVPKRYAMIEGLGYIFTSHISELNLFLRLLRLFVIKLYSISLSLVDKVFFLNPDDQAEFLELGLVNIDRSRCIGGIGIDLNKWSYEPLADGPPRFLMIARLLREKGLYEYVEAAKLVKRLYPYAKFTLLGDCDLNPGSIKTKEVEEWVEQGILEWHGHVPVSNFLRMSYVYVLPSYREGVPVSTMEAMATGRAILTTDVPGCRETVVDGVNGFMVPAKDAVSLAEKMIWFIENPSNIASMGAASRKMAEEKFDVRKINAKIIQIMLSDENEKTV